jgi:hypothetical protein
MVRAITSNGNECTNTVKEAGAGGLDLTLGYVGAQEESPRVLYAHYMGHGPAVELATSLRSALALSKTPLEKPATATEEAAPAWVKAVEDAVGRKGTYKSGVLSYGVARRGAITMGMGGTTIAPAAGVAEAINFQAADSGNVATTGDFVLTAEEVNPVISELQGHQISVTALHSHMLSEQPRLFFMHFWSVGTPEAVVAASRLP